MISNPYNIRVSDEVAVMALKVKGGRKPARIAKVTRVTAKLFIIEGGVPFRLSDLKGHGHLGSVSTQKVHRDAARRLMEKQAQENEARARQEEARKNHPCYNLALRLTWGTLTDTEIIERWMRLPVSELQNIINVLERAGVDL